MKVSLLAVTYFFLDFCYRYLKFVIFFKLLSFGVCVAVLLATCSAAPFLDLLDKEVDSVGKDIDLLGKEVEKFVSRAFDSAFTHQNTLFNRLNNHPSRMKFNVGPARISVSSNFQVPSVKSYNPWLQNFV